ncbi:MAG: thiolase family protein [Pseudomonadales bacterium]|nr:thiolase family protein [Pseudomonadales bacterium]MBO6702235.1 thiolase family protein [Pseudomonadales bacterium]MBO7007664.1 thiolase family protein [Pseudomonadales bacterium]
MEDVYLSSGTRSALGDFGGSLRDVEFTELASHVARACIEKSGASAEAIDHIVFTTTCPTDKDSLFSARVVGMKSGLPEEAAALDVSRACASGLQAIISAGQQITSGQSQLALAAGAEMFSRAPYAVTTARWGNPRGNQQLEDVLEWCYRCPFSLEYMGDTAENLAEKYQYEREPMDQYAVTSQARALSAIQSGFLAKQIVPVEVPEGRSTRVFDTDESPREGITMERLAKLRPAFQEGGKVTAGNSSGVTDGAGAILVGTRAAMESSGASPEARVVDWAVVGVPPSLMGHGPVPAIEKLLARTGLTVDDIDYFEVNEAFAVVNLHVEAQLGIPRDKHNLYGGGISVGHPPGVTGLRMAMNGVQHLRETGGRYAILSMCLGAGQGLAMLIENVD